MLHLEVKLEYDQPKLTLVAHSDDPAEVIQLTMIRAILRKEIEERFPKVKSKDCNCNGS